MRIISERVDDPLRIRGFKDPRIRVKCLKNYKELKIWQRSYQLCLKVYKVTTIFTKEERYGLTSQIRRSAVSIL
ncbi:MAG: four helix bundle protein, partial [Deltaproteobacteria bacterium]|nr:four helix bundle protein [Deltaproteobacteria bacterium]